MEPVLIVGTGALACLYAARLAAAGVRRCACWAAWPEGLAALRHYGVTLVGPHGGRQQSPTRCRYSTSRPSARPAATPWCWSRPGRPTRPPSMPGHLPEPTTGWRSRCRTAWATTRPWLSGWAPARAAQGVTTGGATLLSSGRVRPAGEGTALVGGTPAYSAAGRTTAPGRLQPRGARRRGLAGVGQTGGQRRHQPADRPAGDGQRRCESSRYSARQLSAGLADEVARRGRRQGHHACRTTTRQRRAAQVAEDTAANHSSMLQDVQRGTPTEIEAINGAVVREGPGAGRAHAAQLRHVAAGAGAGGGE